MRPAPAVSQPLSKDVGRSVPTSTAGRFSALKILAIVILLALPMGLGLLAHRVSTQRSLNTAVRKDVLGAGTALDALRSNTSFDLTLRGPAFIPGVTGPPISAGTTLYVRRGKDGATYVRGSHSGGTATYYFQNGTLYVQ